MAKVKHTKTALKAQRDSLRRFERYLPTLQLKKQQLQMEVRQVEIRMEEKDAAESRLRSGIEAWIRLFGEPFDFPKHLRVERIEQTTGNIAGVNIPVLQRVVFQRTPWDLFETPSWVDDGILALEELIRVRTERRFLEEARRLLAEELRVTSQRVNLFEKVKIPECRENIRVIRIFLGDQQTADVARGKLAKGRTIEKVRAA